ncbi:uncharacterized protein LOC143857000 [Tasmannia lanceolata]|uniref:uncharacterized protein LOC143857000 n=1 Tax=Tasmannia lanceolata TaxID=3420 RepID=UPI004062EDDD
MGKLPYRALYWKKPYIVSLRDALTRKWNLKGNLQIFTMDHGFFLFKFSCAEDCTRVLEDNGQNYGGRPLILQRWDLDVLMERKKISVVPIWIKLHGLHLKFWNSHYCSRIASLIGKPFYMDTQTVEASRLNYARMCILVNADQILPDSIKLCTSSREITQPIEYAWKPRACVHCLDFSHGTDRCHLQSNQAQPQTKKVRRPIRKTPMETVTDSFVLDEEIARAIEKGKQIHFDHTDPPDFQTPSSDQGGWQKVQRKKIRSAFSFIPVPYGLPPFSKLSLGRSI